VVGGRNAAGLLVVSAGDLTRQRLDTGARLVPYRAMFDVPHEVVEHVSWLIYARRCELNSRWGRLG
jgi:hypothetical protein